MSEFAIAVLHERRGTYLNDCLKRLAGAIKSANETIVVTDPSDNRAAEEIGVAQSKYDFRVVHAPDDFAARKNAAIRETRGNSLAVVSALDMPEEGCVEALVEFLGNNPSAAAAGALLMRENGYPRHSALRPPSVKRSLAGFLKLAARLDIKGYYFGRRARRIEKPIIASINGDAVGFGCTLSLTCDIRIASETARFGLGFVRIGVTPEFGSTFFLPRIVGVAKALELLFTGKIIDAAEAKEIGMVNQVVPADHLEKATLEMARAIAMAPPLSIRMIKKGVYQGLENDLDTQVLWEHLVFTMARQTEDHYEGIKAFLEKRKPDFKGK